MRLPPVPGEWIDRSRPLEFRFEGAAARGLAGDTISSALWAQGLRTLGRSFKYHRPRGLLSFANHDANVIVQQGDRLNVRADVSEAEPSAQITAVNTFGGLQRDRGAMLGRISAVLPVGFYYKAFYTRRLFPMWERMFRRLTGLGRVDFAAPRLRTPKQYGFCDVLVIGAGPSGLAAAVAAGEAGARVVVVDENARPGGSGFYQLGGDARTRAATQALLDRIGALPKVQLLSGTCAAGYYADHWVPLIDAGRLTKMRAGAVVVASGAFEQPAVFRNNDLPGVMLASAAQRLIYRYAVQPMRRAVVLTANSDGYRAALDLLAAGVQVATVVDVRADAGEPLLARLRDAGVEAVVGACVYEAVADPNSGALAAARICRIAADGEPDPASLRTIECDGLVMSVGWAAAANLLHQAGATMRYDDELAQFVPDRLPEGIFACGRVNGVFGFERRLADGRRAGLAAASRAGFGHAAPMPVERETQCPSHAWPIVSHPRGKNFVDFDEDLQLQDLENAAQEGFDSIELLKRYSTLGMGPSQGKHSNMNGLRVLARLTGQSPQQVGTTTARAFFHPVSMAHLAGRGFVPERHTPLRAHHERLGAQWMPAGVWMRPEYYRIDGRSREQCIRNEARRVRSAVGIIDVGTLGKLDVRGPQAAEFLERVYTGRYARMKVGSTRYAVMCDEAGVLVDEGVVARLAEDHFYFTTTTSGAANVYRELSRLNAIWQLDCGLINLTGASSAVNLAGPRSREVLGPLTDLDLSGAAFPYLAVRAGRVAGIAARLMRVGFVGEWGFEIHVAAEHGPALWDALMSSGERHGIGPFGVEAQRLLRLEKGHLILGQDTDGLTTPFDVGLKWAVAMDKPFFVGQRSLKAIAAQPPRQQLAPFTLAPDHAGEAPKECHLVIENGSIAGRVTSIYASPQLERTIGLAFVRPEMAQQGRRFSIRLSDGRTVTAQVAQTPFYDPKDERQKESG
ncbi:MAG: FAD-dependent oxidoreductase [Betaproteobacteria bacterium]|nr:MAG: FAD-dependent oxidoreductase [Betaproteobacteria bacterium]